VCARLCVAQLAARQIAAGNGGVMRATDWEFKNRAMIFGFILGVPFSLYTVDHVNAVSVVGDWLAGPLKMTGDAATQALLGVAALLMVLAAAVRTWASAFLNAAVVYAAEVKTAALVADGPYRYMRNPLYFGNVLIAVAMGALMSRLGFVVTLVAMLFFCYRLIFREEGDLLASQGESFRAYLAAVPRLLPSPWPRTASAGSRARWGDGFLAESWCWGFAAAVVIFAVTLNIKVFYLVLGISLISFWVSSSVAEKRATRN
jgi:protein-S-isoprenylcysteine O-methyltransferase Ste14